MDINTSPRSIFLGLLTAIVFLVIANSAGLVSKYAFGHDFLLGLVPLFDFDTERNLPTFYSSLQLLLAACLLLIIGAKHKSQGDNYVAWISLALIFTYLAIDETAGFHEAAAVPIRNALQLGGLLYFSWVVPYGIALAIFLVVFAKFLLGLPKETLCLFMLSGTLFISGAIGLELLGAQEFEAYGEKTLWFALLYTMEETLEMIGIALFIFSLLAYVSNTFQFLRCTIRERHSVPDTCQEWDSSDDRSAAIGPTAKVVDV